MDAKLLDLPYITAKIPNKRVTGMDADCTLEHCGDLLWLEYKEPYVPLNRGEEMYFRSLVRMGHNVLVVHANDYGHNIYRITKLGISSCKDKILKTKDIQTLVLKWWIWAEENPNHWRVVARQLDKEDAEL